MERSRPQLTRGRQATGLALALIGHERFIGRLALAAAVLRVRSNRRTGVDDRRRRKLECLRPSQYPSEIVIKDGPWV